MEKTVKKKRNSKEVSLTVLDDLFQANSHPEALAYSKVSEEIKKEFVFYWGKEREDDMITKENFKMYFEDVSFSVKEDSIFEKILSSFGYNIINN